MNSLLTEEQRLVQSSVRDFVAKEVEPNIRKAYMEERFPTEIIPRWANLGLLGRQPGATAAPAWTASPTA